MTKPNFIHHWYTNGQNADMNCNTWLQDILFKKNQLVQKMSNGNIYNKDEGSFSFHINGADNSLYCDLQSKNLCENSDIILGKERPTNMIKRINDALMWNCTLEISGSKFISNFNQTPKKITLRRQIESESESLDSYTQCSKTAHKENHLEEKLLLDNNTIVNCETTYKIPIKKNSPSHKEENIREMVLLPVQSNSNSLCVNKNTTNNDGIVNVQTCTVTNSNETKGTIGRVKLDTFPPLNSKIENISNPVKSISNARLSRKPAKKFIYPSEITEKTFYKLCEKKSTSLLQPLLNHDDSINSKSDKHSIMSLQDTTKNYTNTSYMSTKEEVKESNLKTESYDVFKSALGNKITVSNESLRNVKKLLYDGEADENEVTSITTLNQPSKTFVNITNTEGNACSTSLSNSFLEHKVKGDVHIQHRNGIAQNNSTDQQPLFSPKSKHNIKMKENDHFNSKIMNAGFVGFHTASNKQIIIDQDILKKAEDLLDSDCEETVEQENLDLGIENRQICRSRSPILNSQLCQKIHHGRTTSISKSLSNFSNINENMNNLNNTALSHKNIKLTCKTETQDIISITEDFLLFSSCSFDKSSKKRQGDEINLQVVKKGKV